ncbi:MAG: VWA domain-containing protein [Candidatus Jordarchaeales archaeon]|nr:VWA domain-containing protein [Candidatus Jordarchaeia archaeon]
MPDENPIIDAEKSKAEEGAVKPLKAVKKMVKKKEDVEHKVNNEKKEEEVLKKMFKEAEEVKTEKAPKKTLRVMVGEGLSGYVIINDADAGELGVYEGAIVEFEDPLSGAGGVALVHLDKNVPVGTAVIEPALSEACGLDEGFEIDMKRFEGSPQKLTKISFGIEPLEGEAEEAIKRVMDSKKEFQDWLDGRVIFKDWVLKNPKLNVNVYIVSTEPPLTGRQVGIINFAEIKEYEIKPWRAAVPFNAILLIDVSRSMLTEDMKVTNIAPAVEAIKTIGGEEIPEVKEFLEQFQEGKSIKRVAGAVFAALLYLVEKVGRGYGEKVAIITYSEDAEPITFLMTGGIKLPYFHPGKSKMAGVSQLSRLIIDRLNRISSQHTNMSQALMKALELIEIWSKEDEEKKIPTMVVLLSDGFPDLWGEEGPPVQVVHDHFSGRNDVVIYTVGIGGDVQERIMEAIASKGRGVYFKADDLGDLLNWYQRLARDLVVRLEV